MLRLFLLLGLIYMSHASRKGGLFCAACHVVVDEIEYEVSKIDPKKILEVDGFRIDPHGNQMKRKKVPYARSETHLIEVTEALCDRMNQYALSTNKDGTQKYVLTNSRDGKPISLENVSMSGDNSEQLRHMCNSIIEDHDETIIEYFKEKHEDPKNEFCSSVAGICFNVNSDDAEEEEEEEEQRRVEL